MPLVPASDVFNFQNNQDGLNVNFNQEARIFLQVPSIDYS